jgi:hypothetical protein
MKKLISPTPSGYEGGPQATNETAAVIKRVQRMPASTPASQPCSFGWDVKAGVVCYAPPPNQFTADAATLKANIDCQIG